MSARLAVTAVAIAFATAASADTTAVAPSSNKLIVDIPTLAPTLAQPAAKAKIICRTDSATGSFVRRQRWCATAQEWKQAQTAARSFTDTVQSDKGRYDPQQMAVDVYMSPGGTTVIGGH